MVSLYRRSDSSLSKEKEKRKKKSERFVDSSMKYSPSCDKKMTSNIRIRLEAVVLRHVGTLGYDLSRIHRYSKLFETWGTSVGEFPIAASYSRSNTNVRLRVDCTRDSGNSHLASGPRVDPQDRGRHTNTEEACDRFYYWPSLNLRKLLSRLHNHRRNLHQTIGLGRYFSNFLSILLINCIIIC